MMMNEVCHDCFDHFLIIYLDDILIYLKTWKEHLQHLEHILYTHGQHILYSRGEDKIYARLSKCSFTRMFISYLGFIIDDRGVTVDPTKVQVLQK